MFHEGSLQSGISRAIQEQKLVACFVRDDGDESALWEGDWLLSGWISSLLAQRAVLLRIEAGSTEAGFLSAFCPISNTPTFVVIQNGQLCEQLTNGIGKEEFINRIRKILGANSIPGATASSATQRAQTPEPVQTSDPSPQTPVPSVQPPPPPTEAQPPYEPPAPISAKAKGKQKATPADPASDVSATKAAQQSARDTLRKKKQEERDELARIQARIEADKAERKAQAEARKAERDRLAQSSPTTSQFHSSTSHKGSQAKEVHLNIRLFDGRTIRSTFPRTAKLQNDVRHWIDEEFAARAENPKEKHPPYFFKQILAPLPSRELSVSDESETLGDIDLAPSATLVLIPIKGYTEAYSGGDSGIIGGVVGGVTGLVGSVFGLASSAVGYVGSALGSVVGYGGSADEEQHLTAGRTLSDSRQPETEAPGASGIRVRTLADQRAREPSQQLYNGNQLNFEPRDDDPNRR